MSTSTILEEIEKIISTKLRKVSLNDINSHSGGFVADRSGKITHLNLDSQNLSDISFLEHLPSLRVLILKENQLKDVSALKNLVNLINLDLSHNKISDTSPIENLISLDTLNLKFNSITHLPEKIAFLPNLKHLPLSGNQLEKPPYKIANKGLESIKDYFRKHSQIKIDRETATTNERNKVFISYSHQDTEWLKRVRGHLDMINYEVADSSIWDDTKIRPGKRWENEIKTALSETKVAVFLITSNFLSSEYINENEIPYFLEAEKEGQTVILQLIAEPSAFKLRTQLAAIQTVNNPDLPLSKMEKAEQEEFLVKLTEMAIEELAKDDIKNDIKEDAKNNTQND